MEGVTPKCPDGQAWLTRPTQVAVTSCSSRSSTAPPEAQSSQGMEGGRPHLAPSPSFSCSHIPFPHSSVTAQVLPLALSYGEASWWVSLLHSPPVWHLTHIHTYIASVPRLENHEGGTS